MSKVSVNEDALTSEERRRLNELRRQSRELVEKVERRIVTTLDSLEASHRRFEQARKVAIAASNLYHEALLSLAEDPDDDYVTALEKREKFERIEREYIDAGVAYDTAVLRVGWEVAQAEK